MKTYTDMLPHIEGNDYEIHFWNAIRGKQGLKEHLVKGIDTATGASTLTPKGQEKYMTAIKQETPSRGRTRQNIWSGMSVTPAAMRKCKSSMKPSNQNGGAGRNSMTASAHSLRC